MAFGGNKLAVHDGSVFARTRKTRDQGRWSKRTNRRMNVIIGLALAATAAVIFILGLMPSVRPNAAGCLPPWESIVMDENPGILPRLTSSDVFIEKAL